MCGGGFIRNTAKLFGFDTGQNTTKPYDAEAEQKKRVTRVHRQIMKLLQHVISAKHQPFFLAKKTHQLKLKQL
ncbi:hypothetical protein PY247_12890 [Acinetobacter proteolyticus]|nr:hypothetical protein [Acinetobacter proteolyticus]WEI17387.1 hypothetical protein PY247_12890 [Acinetobacter proteolyticus]